MTTPKETSHPTDATSLGGPPAVVVDARLLWDSFFSHERLGHLPTTTREAIRDFREAAHDIGRDAATNRSREEADASLLEWAQRQGRLIPETFFERLGPPLSNHTSEHEVWGDPATQRAIKRTWAGFYGQVPVPENGNVGRRNASPSEYLERMALQNAVFGGDLRLEGVTRSDQPSLIIGEPPGRPSLVISQGFLRAKDTDKPHPSPEAIARFMTAMGFHPARHSYYGWFREDGVVMVDAKPDNFILTASGVVPIDLQLTVFTRAQRAEAGIDGFPHGAA